MPVDVLTLQDDIVAPSPPRSATGSTPPGRERALRLSAEALSAYDHVLRCEAHFMSFTKDGNAEARRLAQKATELDPQSADAHVQLGWTHCMDQPLRLGRGPRAGARRGARSGAACGPAR